jgi:hypothetical protein
LLSDISGEAFEHARLSTVDAEALRIAAQASSFALLLDGRALQNSRDRHVEASNARLILRSLVESGVLHSRSRCQLMLTKLDTFPLSNSSGFADDLLDELQTEFAPSVAELRIDRVAARPNDGTAPVKLEDVFERWCDEERQVVSRHHPQLGEVRTPFDRFLFTRRTDKP